MKRNFTYKITEKDTGIMVWQFLQARGYSRHILTHLKRTENGITVNGRRVFTTHRLLEGEVLCIMLEDMDNPESVQPVKLPLRIVYEDEDILVLNKPADMPVHPSLGNRENTLANAVAWYYKERGVTFTYRCINRLDRDTTGLLVLAKHMLSAAILSSMMKQRQIRRTYWALAEGQTPLEDTISLPIGRKPDSIIERHIDIAHGEPAVTHFRTIRQFSGHSLVELKLETGRTHQIRVHMAAIGHPLLGDFLYNPNHTSGLMKRQALHSVKLEFPHPITGENLSFKAPLPTDMSLLV